MSSDLNDYEERIYSQNGEDGIIVEICTRLGLHTPVTRRPFSVEFGVGNGSECNTRHLLVDMGWYGLMMDTALEIPPGPTRGCIPVRKHHITAENINQIFTKHGIPHDLDLLSIDVDGNDYWLWRALDDAYQPRLVVIEYNAQLGPDVSWTVEYAPDFAWDLTRYHGASLLALVRLGKAKGYTLVCCESKGVNAFFIRDDLMAGNFEAKDHTELYMPRGARYSEESGDRAWVEVE